MGFAIFAALIWIVIAAVPVALLISVLVRGLTLPRGLSPGSPAVCGKCLHEVASVSAETPMLERCPECGLPYIRGGVLTLALAKKTRPGMVSVIICWTGLAAVITMIGSGIALSVATASSIGSGMQQSFSQTITAVRTDAGQPTGEPGYEIRFDGDIAYQWGAGASSGTIEMVIRPESGPAARVEVDAGTGAWTIPATGTSGNAFDGVAALDALRLAGIDTTPAYVQVEADALASTVAYIRRDPETALYDVLGNSPVAQTGHAHQTWNAYTWSPTHLANPAQEGDSSGTLRFTFESDTTNYGYTATRSAHAYDGSIAFFFADDGAGPRVDRVTVTVRPPEGWPATMVYTPADDGVRVERAGTVSELTASSAHEAMTRLAESAGLLTPAGAHDPGLGDLAELIDEIRDDPRVYDGPPPAPAMPTPATPPAATGADGQPDGGFVSPGGASQNYTMGSYGPDFPIAAFIVGVVGLLGWIVGLVLIILRRVTIYPEAVLATGIAKT